MAHDDRKPRDPSKPRGRRAAPEVAPVDDDADRAPRDEIHVCIHADSTEHVLARGEGCEEWVSRHVIAAPARAVDLDDVDALCADVVLSQLGRDLDALRASQDAMLANHDAIVDNLRRRIARQLHAIERVDVVAEALPKSEMPHLGGALTIQERTAFEEGWDSALAHAREFVLAALRPRKATKP